MKSTNYYDTLIEVAEDCPVEAAEVPPLRGKNKTAARIQCEMISENPYTYTSDDVIFHVHVKKNNISQKKKRMKEKNFSRRDGHACDRQHSENATVGACIAMQRARLQFFRLSLMNMAGLQMIRI